MTHFHITHIDDVLPHIAGRSDFVVAERPGYTVIDYLFAGPDTFAHPARIECRGLKFGPDGRIIARPLHKFFNIGERPTTQAGTLDFSQPHTIMEKLDGSMIHPAIVDGTVVFMTRMGHTDVAKKAERHLTEQLRYQVQFATYGYTPIFEFTAPDNRIVVPYQESRLTLLAIRETESGAYLSQDDVNLWADHAGLLAVPTHSPAYTTGHDFLAFARAVTGMEGFVVRFADGTMVKAKGDDYVLKHKAKESVLQEKNVLALILRDQLDDVLPLLEPADRSAVERYRDSVRFGIEDTADFVAHIVEAGRGLPQKKFATEHLAWAPTAIRPLCFQVRAGADPHVTVRALILKNTGSATAVDSVRGLFGARLALAANDNTTLEQAA